MGGPSAGPGAGVPSRVKRVPRLAVEFIAHRLPEMMPAYREREETVHAIISQAFSSAVITPGVTTTEDVQWWLREKVQELGMTTWFHPSVDVQRAGEIPSARAGGDPARGPAVDGFRNGGHEPSYRHPAPGLRVRPGETEVPAGLRQCMAASNRMQDILLEEMEVGRTGNEILAAALAQMEVEGITGTIYTHPIGDHGHGAGPLIGRWDAQEGVPVRGDIPLRASTWHSIELQARYPDPGMGREGGLLPPGGGGLRGRGRNPALGIPAPDRLPPGLVGE